ncbi:crossover junction endonuclease EME1 isoform X2 [Papio anubis]|uniref:crossover junction endonuclease EME1 isoform X2 n=1 Tax=Papio anubis TaxID=9555 RepID=UPI000B7B4E40|nr:crossover junction endonuclease EME1 isoform X2 [Papio anubis]
MALRKSSPSRDSGDSDSEELPTFAFLKKEPSSTKRRQPEREEKIVVVDISDSEASCPPTPGLLSPPVSDTAETVTQTQPVRLLSSESEDEEEFIPLAQRLTCKFLTYKQPSPEDSSSPIKSVLDHQNNEGVSCDWKKQPFPKIPEVPLHDTPEKSAADNKDLILDPCRQLPAYPSTCPGQSSSLVVTKANSDILPPQKKTKQSQKVQGRGSQGCRQQRQARQKESTLRRQERKNAALVTRMKAQRPEECLKYVIVVLDPVLLQMEGGGQLLGALQSMQCRCVIEAQAVPCSVTWRRRAGPSEDGEDWVEEPTVLVLLRAETFVSMIYNGKQGRLDSTMKGKETFQGFVTDITARTAGKALSLVIVDQEKCFSTQNPPSRGKQGTNKQTKEKQRKQPEASIGSMVSRVDAEEALVDLQLHTEAQAQIVQSWKELADFTCAFTKAVAETPFNQPIVSQAGGRRS